MIMYSFNSEKFGIIKALFVWSLNKYLWQKTNTWPDTNLQYSVFIHINSNQMKPNSIGQTEYRSYQNGPIQKLQRKVSKMRPYSQHFIFFVAYRWANWARVTLHFAVKACHIWSFLLIGFICKLRKKVLWVQSYIYN